MSYYSSSGPIDSLLSIVVPKALKDPHAAKTAKSSRRLFDANDRNGPELPGSGRSRWTTNHLVTQQQIRNNRTYPDLWAANPLVAGSSPARPTSDIKT